MCLSFPLYFRDMEEEIRNTLQILKEGGIILYPTDTIWGIGCDATNEKAVQRIYELKKRSDSKSMIMLLDNDNKLNRYVKQVPDVAWDLVEYADKPLTIVYPNALNVAKNLLAADGSLGIRICKDPFCAKLIHLLNKPLVSTSANISGNPSPANFSEIDAAIVAGVDHVVNLRQQEKQKSVASSVIKLSVNGQIEILRK